MAQRTATPIRAEVTVTVEPERTTTRTVTYAVTDPSPVLEAEEVEACHLQVGDRVALSKYTNDQGWALWHLWSRHVGTVVRIEQESEPNNASYSRKRAGKRLLVTVDRGARSLDVIYAIPRAVGGDF